MTLNVIHFKRYKLEHDCSIAAPSQPPSQFIVFVNSSTSITASWQLPPVGSRHGIIKGYKLFYKKKDSDSATLVTLSNRKTSERVTKLDKYTEYEFQVLAFTSTGDGPNSSTVFKTTMEDGENQKCCNQHLNKLYHHYCPHKSDVTN